MIHKFTLRPVWLWRKHLVLWFKSANWTQDKTVFHMIDWEEKLKTHLKYSSTTFPFSYMSSFKLISRPKVSNALNLPKAQRLFIMFFSLEADLSKAQPPWPISTPPWDQGRLLPSPQSPLSQQQGLRGQPGPPRASKLNAAVAMLEKMGKPQASLFMVFYSKGHL